MISHRDFQNRLMGTGEPHSTELILHLFKSIPIECMCLICVHTQWMIFSIHLTIECPMNKQPFSMPNLFPIRFYSPFISPGGWHCLHIVSNSINMKLNTSNQFAAQSLSKPSRRKSLLTCRGE
eukprot:45511_1